MTNPIILGQFLDAIKDLPRDATFEIADDIPFCVVAYNETAKKIVIMSDIELLVKGDEVPLIGAQECEHCAGSGEVAIRTDGTYRGPGPVPEDARGISSCECGECCGVGYVES